MSIYRVHKERSLILSNSLSVSQKFQSCNVALSAQSADNRERVIAQVALMSEVLPSMDVGEVYLDEWDGYTGECISQRDTGMCQSTCVYDDVVGLSFRLMNSVDDETFVIRLECLEFNVRSNAGRVVSQICFDLFESGLAVDLWFAGTQKVEVWTVDEKDSLWFGHFE